MAASTNVYVGMGSIITALQNMVINIVTIVILSVLIVRMVKSNFNIDCNFQCHSLSRYRQEQLSHFLI